MVRDYDGRMCLRRLIPLLMAAVLFGLAGCEVQKPLKGQVTSNQLSARLAKHAKVILPTKVKPPYPTVLLFHGCGGVHSNAEAWANGFASIGFAAVIVDSLTTRGMNNPIAVDKVCKGFALTGTQRSADVLAMIGWARKKGWAKKDEIYLAGWSHGGWAVLSYLSQDVTATRLPGLRNIPNTAKADAASVSGVMLFYPHCGAFSKSAKSNFTRPTPLLMMLAEKDRVVSVQDCLALHARLVKQRWPALAKVYPRARHSFDVPEKANGERNPEFSKAATGKSMKDIMDFLIKVKALNKGKS